MEDLVPKLGPETAYNHGDVDIRVWVRVAPGTRAKQGKLHQCRPELTREPLLADRQERPFSDAVGDAVWSSWRRAIPPYTNTNGSASASKYILYG